MNKQQSGWGAASFVIGFLNVPWLGIVTAVACSQEYPVYIPTASTQFVGTSVICIVFLAILGVAIGIVGRLQRDRSQSLTIIGFYSNLACLTPFGVVVVYYFASRI